MTDIIYKASPHQRHQWRYHTMVTPSAKNAEMQGTKRFEGFGTFAEEIFHKLYSDQPVRVEIPAEGTEVFQKLDACIEEIPELTDLKIRCTGNEHFSAISSCSIIEQLLQVIPDSETTVPNPIKDADIVEMLKQLLANSENPEQQKALNEALETARKKLDNSLESVKHAAENLNVSDIRNAVRRAVTVATAEIQADNEMVTAFSIGTENTTNKAVQKKTAEKLRELVQRNPKMKEIAKLAGRLQRIAAEKQRQKVRSGVGQIEGVTLGDSLIQLLPSELAYLDEALEDSFAARYIQKGLLNWEISEKATKQQGPIVMLIDASGSMKYENRDQWSTAVALAFMDIAKQQNRAFALVHFNTEIVSVNVWEIGTDWTVESIVSAISVEPSGGTSFMLPLKRAEQIIRSQKSFMDADIILVTDGKGRICEDWLEGFKTSQAQIGFSVYSILIGEALQSQGVANQFSNQIVALTDALRNDSELLNLFSRV